MQRLAAHLAVIGLVVTLFLLGIPLHPPRSPRTTSAAVAPGTSPTPQATMPVASSPARRQLPGWLIPNMEQRLRLMNLNDAPPQAAVSPTSTPVAQTVEPTATASAPLAVPAVSQSVPILMYHYIRPKPGPDDPLGQALSVEPQEFAREMDWLAGHGFTTLTLAEFGEARAGHHPLPLRPVVLTFDDGYRDFYINAWPILLAHHFKATVFVITGVVGSPQYMTWDMLRELDRSGLVEVAGHSVHHLDLTQLNGSALVSEVTGCAHAIAQELGHPPVSFAYPAGRVNDAVVSAVRAAGFQFAVTTKPGAADASDPPWLLPRVRVRGDTTLDEFAALLSPH